MFSLGWMELFIVMVILLVVMKPADLPGSVAKIVRFVRYARQVSTEILSDIYQASAVEEARQAVQKAEREFNKTQRDMVKNMPENGQSSEKK